MLLRINMTGASEFRLLDRVRDIAIGTVNSGSKEWKEKSCAEACCADLTGANVTLEQLAKARSLKRTIMADGTGHD